MTHTNDLSPKLGCKVTWSSLKVSAFHFPSCLSTLSGECRVWGPECMKKPDRDDDSVFLERVTYIYPMDCSLPGFSVHEIFKARVPEWVASSFSRGSS